MGKHQVDWEAKEPGESKAQSLYGWFHRKEWVKQGRCVIWLKSQSLEWKKSSPVAQGLDQREYWLGASELEKRGGQDSGLGLGVGWLGCERHANGWTVRSSGNEKHSPSPASLNTGRWKTGLIYATCSVQDGFLPSWPFHTFLSLCNFHLLDLRRFQLTLGFWHKMLLDEHIPSVICSGGTHHLSYKSPGSLHWGFWRTVLGLRASAFLNPVCSKGRVTLSRWLTCHSLMSSSAKWWKLLPWRACV